MAVINLRPNRGARSPEGARVTIAWVREKAKAHPKLRIMIGAAIVAQLGWKAKTAAGAAKASEVRLEGHYKTDDGTLRLSLCRDGYKLSMGQSTGVVSLSAPWVRSELRRAEEVEHRIQDGYLALRMPTWVSGIAEPTKPVAPAAAPRPLSYHEVSPKVANLLDALTDSGEDAREAFEMVRRGQSAFDLADHFGWHRKIEKIRHLIEAVRDEGMSTMPAEMASA